MSGGRKGKWGITLAALVVVVALLVMGWLHWRQPRGVAAIAPAAAAPSRVSEQHPGNPRPAASPAAASSSAATMDSTSGTEVCGFGRLPATTVDPNDVTQYIVEKSRNTYDRWKATLLDSSDLRARAIGLVLQRLEFRRDDSAAQADESRDELVQLAAGGNDPIVYGIAAGVCQTGVSDADATGACRRISLTAWARLDPDNLVPWIAIAQAARTRGDASAEATAFARAAAARKVDTFTESLLSFALSEMPQDATPLEKWALTIELIGVESAWGRPVIEMMRYCSVDAVKQDEPRKECNAVAELLVGPETTLLNFGFGGKLGERAGWPAERVRQIDAEKEELLQLTSRGDQSPWSCDTVARMNAFTAERAQIGELAALRKLKSSPLPPAR